MEAFAGIGDAIAAGEWALAVNVALAAVQVVWMRFKAWVWGANELIKNGFYDVWEDIQNFIADIIGGMVNNLSLGVTAMLAIFNRLRAAAGMDAIEFNPGAMVTGFLRADPSARLQRDEDRQAGLGLFAGGIANRQGDLAFANAEAETARIVAEMGRQAAAVGNDNEGINKPKVSYQVLGGFSAQQAFGFLGATTKAEDPINQVVRNGNRHNELLLAEIELLRQLIAIGIPAFG